MTFVAKNWFNLVSMLLMLFAGVRIYTYNETTTKSFMSSMNETVGDLKSVVKQLQTTVAGMDKSQAVDKECLNNLKEDVKALKERRYELRNRP